MKQVLFSPHTSISVLGLEFYEINLPENINPTSLAKLTPCNAKTISTEGKAMQEDGSFIFKIPKKSLEFKWNVIVSRSSGDTGTRINSNTYLAMVYWDSLVSTDEKFTTLSVHYSSNVTVKPSSDLTSITVSFIDHTRAEAISSKGTTTEQTWIAHPQLDTSKIGEVDDIGRRKVYWSTENPDFTYTRSSSNSPLVGYTSTSEIKHNDSLNSVKPKSFTYECIPKNFKPSNIDNIKLLVSPRFGVGLYDKTTGKVASQNPNISYNLCANNTTKEFEVYQYGKNVTLFYYPNEYRLFVSCRKADQTWETPWEVGIESRGSRDFKVVVPSYVDVIPFVFLYSEGNWNITHVLALTSDYDKLMSPINEKMDSFAYNPANYSFTGSYYVETFFSDTGYINPFMWNETLGYTDSYKYKIRDYWFVQLYYSYTTFIQALKYVRVGTNPDPQMLDCGIRSGDSFIAYSQDAWGVINKNSESSNAFTIDNLKSIDNFLAYDGTKIINMLSGSSVSVTDYKNVQMKHGIVIGFNSGGTCEQLQ